MQVGSSGLAKMKTPRLFIPGKNLDETIESLLLEKQTISDYDTKTVSVLLKSCDTFMKKLNVKLPYMEIYTIGKYLAEKIDYYTQNDLEELSKRITKENCQDMHLGFYISALINKITMGNDVITLELALKLDGIGAYQKEGTTIVKGKLGNFTGHYLIGGTLIVDGDTAHGTGNLMKMGKIIITGESGIDTGNFMEGGEIITYGEIKSIASSCKGTIYSQGKRLI